jgi:TolB-like protein/DNA-binding winged helix-turn-helix (wHTH) protein/Tfp pilus assembly protein PilF
VIRFGAFEFDPSAGELRKGDLRIKLQAQPSQLLLALIERAGQVVTREELRQRLWPGDTFVDFNHGLNIAVNKIREALDDSTTTPRFVETLPRRGYRFVAAVERIAASPSPRRAIFDARFRRGVLTGMTAALVTAAVWFTASWVIRSQGVSYRIAVLPLKNLSAEPDSDYFTDGLTDEIVRHLAVIDGLDVRSRASSFAFKGASRDMREIGRQLGVDLVLEGSVLREGRRLHVSADLVRAADDRTVWSAAYDREIGDTLAVQDELARSIVNLLRLEDIGGQRRYRIEAEAYDHYIQAQALAKELAPGKARQQRRRRAIDLFKQTIDRQPDFAPAYASLALVYANLRNRGQSQESGEMMRQAAEKAIALDPLLPEAFAANGLTRAAHLAWSDAEQAFQRAVHLDPSASGLRSDFAQFVLLPEGKITEALQQVRRAAELDPLVTSYKIQLAFVLLRAGRYTEAREISKEVLATNQNDDFARTLFARSLLLEGKPAEALRIFETQGPGSHGYLGYAYARVGRRLDAERLAAEDDPAAARHQVLIYAALGDRAATFEALQKIADMDDFMADLYPGEPELAMLRDDPRMKDFRRIRNLP